MSQSSQSSQTYQLGNMPMNGLFIKMAVPIILGLLVSGLYNVVDIIFVGMLHDDAALAGVQLIFPVQMLMFSISALIGAGAASIISRALGAKDHEKANRTAIMALSLVGLIGAIISVVVYILCDQMLEGLGAKPNQDLFLRAKEYVLPIIYGAVFMLSVGVMNDLFRSEGKMQYMMTLIMISAISNTVLDPFFMFQSQSGVGLGLGVSGAAYATLCAQILATIMGIIFYSIKRTQIKIHFKYLKFNFTDIKTIILLGFPIFLTHAGVSIIIMVANKALSDIAGGESEIYIGAYGVLARVYMFFVLPCIAMMITFQTIAGFNYGAKQYRRVHESIVVSIKIISLYSLAITCIMIFVPHWIFNWFYTDETNVKIVSDMAGIVFFAFPLTGVFLILTAYFQSAGHAGPALIFSSAKVYAIQLPLLIFMPRLMGIDGVFYAYPAADVIAILLVSVYSIKEFASLLKREKTIEIGEQ
ncbi:MATE family efflux transporter [Marinicellulosiphila megalodicopiae]|uniref:MATE family efflux transporter n=1 Tax=Marinicellulosiphila megalodicopiae TaxID=2724896 RepID=UPI003BB18B23